MTAAISLRFIPLVLGNSAQLPSYTAGANLKLVAFGGRQQIAFTGDSTHIEWAAENAQDQRANKSAHNYDGERPLRIRTDSM